MAFGLWPLPRQAAIETLDARGSDELKKVYLGKLISGEWFGTMQLTELPVGTDVVCQKR